MLRSTYTYLHCRLMLRQTFQKLLIRLCTTFQSGLLNDLS
jgi:hypothetical protein